jgi:hypothetical protein
MGSELRSWITVFIAPSTIPEGVERGDKCIYSSSTCYIPAPKVSTAGDTARNENVVALIDRNIRAILIVLGISKAFAQNMVAEALLCFA